MITAALDAVLRFSAITLLFVGLTSCSLENSSRNIGSDALKDNIVLIPSADYIDFSEKITPIEKYILSLPVRPEMKSFFEDIVIHARVNHPTENKSDSNKLFIGGDGSGGLITFRLNRDDQSLRVIEVDQTRIPNVKHEYYLYKILGGWIQSRRPLPAGLRSHSYNRVDKYWGGISG